MYLNGRCVGLFGSAGNTAKLVRRVCLFCDGGLHQGVEQNQGPCGSDIVLDKPLEITL